MTHTRSRRSFFILFFFVRKCNVCSFLFPRCCGGRPPSLLLSLLSREGSTVPFPRWLSVQFNCESYRNAAVLYIYLWGGITLYQGSQTHTALRCRSSNPWSHRRQKGSSP